MPDSIIQQPLAVVGMECRLPAADSIDAFWKLLVDGQSAVGPLNDRVLDRNLHYDSRKGVRGKTYSQIGGLVPERPLARELLGLSDEELSCWDECHLMFAEVASRAWRSTMQPPSGSRSSKVGVYIGHSGGSRTAGEMIYAAMAEQTADLLSDSSCFAKLPLSKQESITKRLIERMRFGRPVRGQHGRPYLEANAAARLVAEVLDLEGPRMVLDAACASSLVALGLAALDLQAGSIDAAIVGGASYNKVDSLILFSQAQSCSATASRPFDEAADGLISSEGYIAIVVKTLEKAIRDGDTIHGVLRGLGVATDGRGKSLWAPRREGQTMAMRRAYSSAHEAKRVQYVEAHATSTQVGDATETKALADFFGEHHAIGSLPVGSVKSNIGHTLETAGLAGLLKTMLAMKHAIIPPTIHLENPSSSIDWAAGPFHVPTTCIDWQTPPDDAPRCGAVNAFGIGGLNVHVVIEQFQPHYHRSLFHPRLSKADSAKPLASNESCLREPIAIVGCGVIVPGAQSLSELTSLIESRVSKIVTPPSSRWRKQIGVESSRASTSSDSHLPTKLTTARGGYLLDYAYDWKRHRVPPKQVDRANPLQFMLLDAAGQALEPTIENRLPSAQNRTSVIVGTLFGGEFGHQLQLGLRIRELQADLQASLNSTDLSPEDSDRIVEDFTELVLKANPALLDETGSFTSSTLASRITKQFNLMGGAMAIDAGDCSSEAALVTATEMLRANVSDMVLCAAGQRAMDLPSYQSWVSKGQLRDDEVATQLPSEGAIVLSLKRYGDAVRSGDQVLGIIHDVHRMDSLVDSKATPHIDEQSRPFSTDELVQQIGDLKSAQTIFSVAALLASENVDEAQPYSVCSHSSSNVRYEIIVSKGSHHRPMQPLSSTDKRPNGVQSNSKDDTISSVSTNVAASMPADFSLLRWTDDRHQEPLLTAVFPGQGSQSLSMLDEVLAQSRSAREALEQANATLAELGSPSFSQLNRLAIDAPSREPRIWPIQAVMMIADVVYAACMDEQGIRPDIVVGHSLGELAAMVVAGAWSLPESLRFVHARSNAVLIHTRSASGLLSINRGAEEVDRWLGAFPAPIVLTHDNGPNQSVVGGQLEHLRDFQAFLATQRSSSVVLDVPSAFHTSLMVDAQHALVDTVKLVRLRPPSIPIMSTVTGRFVCDPAELRRNLLTQLVMPVLYRTCIEQAFSHGSRRFIEVGPGSVLTRLNKTIVQADQAQCIAMEGSTELCKPIPISSKSPASNEPIVSFDATAPRRQKRREQSLGQVPLKEHSLIKAPAPVPMDAVKDLPAPTTPSSPLERREAQSFSVTDDLAAFVRDFIVEHTGYPAEMIDFDWDLEADLGIDSIKQAQLFGELRELFDIDVDRLTTHQARTIRQIVSVLKDSGGGKREWIEVKNLAAPHSPMPTNFKSNEPNPFAVENTSKPSLLVPAYATGAERSAIAEFMIDFVMEHTGYPREIIDPKADFEADLGLDSIKLAQLFGELRSNFDLAVAANDRSVLAKCRTLDDILELFSKDDLSEEISAPNDGQADDAIFDDGLAWGSNHASSIQMQLVDQIDRLDAIEKDGTLAFHPHRTKSLGSPLALEKTPRGRVWWRGVVAGAGIDEEYLSSDLDTLARLLDSTIADSLDPLYEQNCVASSDSPREDFQAELAYSDSSVTHRYRMKMIDAPLPDGAPRRPVWKGAAVILGDNAVARALATSLESQGVLCARWDANLPTEQLVARLDDLWQRQPVMHCFLATPHDRDAAIGLASKDWQARRRAGMMSAFGFCQAWLKRVIEAGRIQDASLIALSRLGGDFGFNQSIVAPESGALAGLLKAMVIENWVNGHRGLAVKIVDAAASDTPEQLVDVVYRELANSSYDMEISWSGGSRRVVRAERSPIQKLKEPTITRGGSWICTGGGRGITAFVAEQIALRYDLTLHLIGTAPVPNVRDEWRNLQGEALRNLKLSIMQQARNDRSEVAVNPIKAWENTEKALEIDATIERFKKLGIRTFYHSCDCSDATRLKAVVDQIRTISGPIRGCLHGAGVGQDARFDRKRLEKVEQCLSAKLDGSIALMEATLHDPLEFFIGFGSISGRFGANGHTDYSMANDGLAKCIGWYRERRPSVRAVCFHWHAWGDVGMATKPETKLALEMIDMQFMPAREGVQHLIRELEGGAPDREVLITDDRYYRLFYPSEVLASSEEALASKETFGLLTPDNRCNFDPIKDVFLREHRLNDRPLMPMVIGLEAIVEAASRQLGWLPIQYGGASIRVDRLESLRGLRFFQDTPQDVQLMATLQGTGQCYVELVGDFHARDGRLVEARRRYMHATVSPASHDRLLDWEPIDASQLQWLEAIYPAAHSAFYVGPAFRVLKQTCLRNDRILGRIQAPSLIELAGAHREVIGWRSPSALLDACLFATGVLAWNYVQPGINLPVSFETILLRKMPVPGETCIVESRFVRRDERNAWFDFCVWGSDGTPRVEVVGYRTSWLESELPMDRS